MFIKGNDQSVQGTNDDAQISKLSCTRKGYFKDDFIHYFVRRATNRAPLINRGYYSRYACLRHLLSKYLNLTQDLSCKQQILILGAGFDTTWFQLKQDGEAPSLCVEVDFAEVTQRKVSIITSTPALRSMLSQAPESPASEAATTPAAAHIAARSPSISSSGTARSIPATAVPPNEPSRIATTARPDSSIVPEKILPPIPPSPLLPCSGVKPEGSTQASVTAPNLLPTPPLFPAPSRSTPVTRPPVPSLMSPEYCIMPVDLRNLEQLESALLKAGMDPAQPTYILAECVLVYMEPEECNRLVAWLAKFFKCCTMAVYEQIKPDDAFGRQMVANLEARGCPLKGLAATPTLEAHRARFLGAGWDHATATDMDTLYQRVLDPLERQRVECLELFDEFEEWHMIQEHYCIVVAIKDDTKLLASFGFS